jgi:hypothetical protein
VEAEGLCCGGAGIVWTLDRTATEATVDITVPDELRGSPQIRIIGEVITSPADPA